MLVAVTLPIQALGFGTGLQHRPGTPCSGSPRWTLVDIPGQLPKAIRRRFGLAAVGRNGARRTARARPSVRMAAAVTMGSGVAEVPSSRHPARRGIGGAQFAYNSAGDLDGLVLPVAEPLRISNSTEPRAQTLRMEHLISLVQVSMSTARQSMTKRIFRLTCPAHRTLLLPRSLLRGGLWRWLLGEV